MTRFEIWQLSIGAVSAAAFFVPLVILAIDQRQQKKALHYEIYQRINLRYANHILMPLERPHLDDAWFPLPAQRREKLEAAKGQRGERHLWPVWEAMEPEERDRFRWTRTMFEIFEEAHHAHERGMIAEDTWGKWQMWIQDWRASGYLPYVYEEIKERWRPTFVQMLEEHLFADQHQQLPGPHLGETADVN